MKKLLALAIVASMFSPMFTNAVNTYVPKKAQTYIMGPKGGCYYWNKKGNKTYVSRSLCAKKK